MAIKHRRRKIEDPGDRTARVTISISERTMEGLKAEADKAGMTLSHLMERLSETYLRTRRRLTTD